MTETIYCISCYTTNTLYRRSFKKEFFVGSNETLNLTTVFLAPFFPAIIFGNEEKDKATKWLDSVIVAMSASLEKDQMNRLSWTKSSNVLLRVDTYLMAHKQSANQLFFDSIFFACINNFLHTLLALITLIAKCILKVVTNIDPEKHYSIS